MDDFPDPADTTPTPWHENPYYILPGSFAFLLLVLAGLFLVARAMPERSSPAAGSGINTETAVPTAVSSTPIPTTPPTGPPTAPPTSTLTRTPSPTDTAVPTETSTTRPTASPSATATSTVTAIPPTATAIPRPLGGFPALELDAWELPGHEFCQSGQGYRAIFMEGHGGDGLYTYYWNDEPISEPLYKQSFTYQAAVGGGSSQGQVKVVSGDGKVAIVILFVKGLECPN